MPAVDLTADAAGLVAAAGLAVAAVVFVGAAAVGLLSVSWSGLLEFDTQPADSAIAPKTATIFTFRASAGKSLSFMAKPFSGWIAEDGLKWILRSQSNSIATQLWHKSKSKGFCRACERFMC
jgi:hypothetical protein